MTAAPGAHAGTRAPGLLVLPFAYRGSDMGTHGFLGDAVGSEILNRVAAAPLEDLRVLSWATAQSYRNSPRRADELARELGIRYLVEGAVTAAGERWSIDVRVVDAPEDRVVLAERFDASSRDVLKLHTIIADCVHRHLSLTLDGGRTEPFWNAPVDPAAFLAYLQALQVNSSATSRANLERAIALTDEAIALDPGFVPAQALRALSLHFYADYFGRDDPSVRATARAAAQHAIEAGPQLATTNILDALIATYIDFDWDRAERRYGFVLDALPSDSHARRNLAFNLGLRARWDRARSELAVARELDRSPRLWLMEGMQALWQRDPVSAARKFEQILAVSPGDAITNHHLVCVLGLVLRDEARLRERLDRLDPAMKATWGPFYDGCLAVARGDTPGVAAARRRQREAAAGGTSEWYPEALMAGAVGDADGVIEGVRRSLTDGHNESVAHAGVEPLFDCARGDPRFQVLLRKVNLAA